MSEYHHFSQLLICVCVRTPSVTTTISVSSNCLTNPPLIFKPCPVQGLLSDGTLAWRFYVVFNKAKWALYLPAGAVAFNARESLVRTPGFWLMRFNVVLCWSADGQHLAAYSRPEYYENTLLPVTLDITVAWGWSMFVANSLMTGGIIYKIM